MLKSGVYGYHVRLFSTVVFRSYCLLKMFRKACKSRFHGISALIHEVQLCDLFKWQFSSRVWYNI